MIKKKLYIHIGTHKTGSTAIQKFLRENSQLLLKENIVYLPIPRISRGLMKITHLDSIIIDQSRKELFKSIKSKQKNSNTKFIWSFEGFSGNPYTGYNNTSIVAESIKKITQGLDVNIIIYLRRQDDFLESLYTQMIHQGESISFNSFVKKYSDNDFNWEELLLNYSQVFNRENIIVKRYDKFFLPGEYDLINDFLCILNIKKVNHFDKTSNINSGYSRDTLEIARLLNLHFDEKEKYHLRHILQRSNTKKPFEKYSYWLENEKVVFFKRYLISNSNVADAYLNESGKLFPEHESKHSKKTYNGLTVENAVVVLGKLLLEEQPKIERSSSFKFLAIIKKFKKKLFN